MTKLTYSTRRYLVSKKHQYAASQTDCNTDNGRLRAAHAVLQFWRLQNTGGYCKRSSSVFDVHAELAHVFRLAVLKDLTRLLSIARCEGRKSYRKAVRDTSETVLRSLCSEF
jgi:hypothetical protein